MLCPNIKSIGSTLIMLWVVVGFSLLIDVFKLKVNVLNFKLTFYSKLVFLVLLGKPHNEINSKR